MNDDVAINVRNVSKIYEINWAKSSFLSSWFSKQRRQKSISNHITALKDVNFKIYKGDCVGIIGLNGAGKSTLLKILSEITEPTSGEIEIFGKVASVLDFGVGIQPDLTGKDNIYLLAAFNKQSKKFIDENLEKIIQFAEIQDYINMPVKYYSSGMLLRLAFSVAVHSEADIYLFDEVLAIGDLAFQQKCKNKIKSLVEKGKTVLIVSHNLNDIIGLCEKVILINNGLIEEYGNINVVQKYYQDIIENKVDLPEETSIIIEGTSNAKTKEHLQLRRVWIENLSKPQSQQIFTDDTWAIYVEFEKFNNLFLDIGVFFSIMDFMFMSSFSFKSVNVREIVIEPGTYVSKVIIPPNLFDKANLSISLAFANYEQNLIMRFSDILMVKIHHSTDIAAYLQNYPQYLIPVNPDLKWEITKIK